jgi:uncharacterized UBP type Zn finger protein
MPTCSHLDATATDPGPATTDPADGRGCVECLASGGFWVHLRRCLACGHIGCCDSSPSRHAAAHFRETGHPVIASFQPGETWRWCFEDQLTG